MIVNAATFETYLGSVGLNSTLRDMYINAAEAVLSSYLGYDVAATSYLVAPKGRGVDFIQSPVYAPRNVALTINGSLLSSGSISVSGCMITLDREVHSSDILSLACDGGWNTSTYLAPQEIINCIFQIAALKASEEGNKLSVVSTQWGLDGGSRTWQNTTNFSKFLAHVNKYRIFDPL